MHACFRSLCNITVSESPREDIVLRWSVLVNYKIVTLFSMQKKHNGGIPGMLISTSCVFNPSLGTTSCLMRSRISLTFANWEMMLMLCLHTHLFDLQCVRGRWGEGVWCVFPTFQVFPNTMPQKADTFLGLTVVVTGLLFWGQGVSDGHIHIKEKWKVVEIKHQGMFWWKDQTA